MRGFAPILIALLIALAPAAGKAQGRSTAVFDFELFDTSMGDPLLPQSAEHKARLARVSERLRERLAESGRFSIVDIAPVDKEAHAANLQSCGGCDVTLASRLGAELAITGAVQKVSNLILRMMILVRDTKTGNAVAIARASMRGDTDESWTRALDWLVRNQLLDPEHGVPR